MSVSRRALSLFLPQDFRAMVLLSSISPLAHNQDKNVWS